MSETETLRHRLERWIGDRTLSHSERFEREALRFYRETGFMAPGKSMPPEMEIGVSDERRQAAWLDWCSQRSAQFVSDVMGALKSITDLEVQVSALTAQVPQWQSIETAPKDGKPLILGAQGEQSQLGFWSRQREYWLKLGAACPTIVWPTHWMPLPSPPRGEDG